MKLSQRIALGATTAAFLIGGLSGCGSVEPISGTISDIGGDRDIYSIQLSGSDKVWRCAAAVDPICRLLEVGDKVTFLPAKFQDDGMQNVTRTEESK